MAKKKSYDVGYGKPPKHSQFKPGKSGNPKGRPKGSKNLTTELAEELAARIPIKEAGKTKKVTKQRAVLMTLIAKALNGDTKSIGLVIGQMEKFAATEQINSSPTGSMSDHDAAIIEAFTAQLKAEILKGKQ